MPSPTAAIPSRLHTVPPFPPVATRLLAMLGQRNVDIAKMAELIASDPLFSGRILQHANSIEFGLLNPVHNVRHALTMLGLERTRAITLNAATSAYSRAALRTAELRRCWQHTLATAVLAEELSRSCQAFMQSAYAAGLMHDIGRLGLLMAYPDEYESTIRNAAQHCLDLLDFERETFGVDHAEAGRWLGERWNLPEQFRIVAGRHHDSCEGAELSLLKIVHIACQLADLFEYDVAKPLQPPNFEALMNLLPEFARECFMSRIDAVYERLKKAVHSFDDQEQPDAPPVAASSLPVLMPREEQYIEPVFEAVDEVEPEPERYPSPGLLARLCEWLYGLFQVRRRSVNS